MKDQTCLILRLILEDIPFYGKIIRCDKDRQFEWVLGEEELQLVGLMLHRLACNPVHEYDYLLEDSWDAGVHFRLTDLQKWI